MPDAVPARNVRRTDVLSRFCLSPSGLHKNLKLGRFPQPFFVGGKPLWREADLAAVEAGTWSPHPKPAPPVVDEDDPGLDDLPPPAPVKRPRGRPPGSGTKATPAPVMARRPTSTLPAHLGGPTMLDQMRGAR